MNEGFEHSRRMWGAIIRDVHFWVPFIVLIIGFLLLRWVD